MANFTDNERIARVYSVKWVPYASGARWSRNRHDFLIPDADVFGAIIGQLDSIGLAERHLMMSPAVVKMLVAVQVPKPMELLEDLAVVARFADGIGGRKEDEGEALAEYPAVLCYRKYAATGRNSRIWFEGALSVSDLVYDDAPRVHLSGSYDSIGLVASYFNSFMLAGAFPYITCTQAGGADYPTSYREIVRFGGATAERITSIPDAQRRKTYKALPYLEYSRAILDDVQTVGIQWHALAHGGYPDYSPEVVSDLVGAVAALASGMVYISQYYGDGQELSDAACWRPTSGLNPYSEEARPILDFVIRTLGQAAQALNELPQNERQAINATDIEGVLPIYWRAIGAYMLFMDKERFTGRPRYIPRALSTCRAS